jgi:AcrR family transcriptional regulator
MSQKLPRELRIETLLNAAVEEFLIKGFDGASVDTIAKRAGVSKGGFYHHFPNKETLLMETNRKLSEPIEEMAKRASRCESAVSGLKGFIREYLSYWIDHPREMSFLFLSMSKAFESEILMTYYKEYVAAETGFFVGMFSRAVEKGELALDDPEVYGVSLMGALDGMISYQVIHPEEDIEALSSRLEKIWLAPARRDSP